MRLRPSAGSILMTLLAGALLAHCGTTQFAAPGGDAGPSDGAGRGTGTGSSSGSGTSTGSGSSSGTGSSSGPGSHSGSGGGGNSCFIPEDCGAGAHICCAQSGSSTGTCVSGSTCPGTESLRCSVPADCPGSTLVCCIAPQTSGLIGVCATRSECSAGSGDAERCDQAEQSPCGSDGSCAYESCDGYKIYVCNWTTACSTLSGTGSGTGTGTGSGTGCVLRDCDYYASLGECGSNLSNGCGGMISGKCSCPGSAVCAPNSADPSQPGSCMGVHLDGGVIGFGS